MISAFVCRSATVGHFETIDEVLWLRRSEVFSNALIHLHPSKASVTGERNPFGGTTATMPGVPTMWLGSIARFVWGLGRSFGLTSGTKPFRADPAGLTLAQLSVAVATSLLIGLIVWLMARWVTPRAAFVTGVLLATEPFWVAHGSVIHTDELTALFGVSGLIALALVLGVPAVKLRYHHRAGLAAVAGVLLVCSPLTKISGLAFAPGAALMVVWAMVRDVQSGRGHHSPIDLLRPSGRVVAIAGIAAMVAVAVLWPASWASPVLQFDRLRDSIHIGYIHQRTFFRGRITRSGSPAFFLVALPLRMTPWMLAASLVGVPVALARRATRMWAVMMLLAVVPVAYTLSKAQQQVDRYGLLILGPLCVVVGLAFAPAINERAEMAARARVLLFSAACLATISSLFVAPWGLAYFNPVLGGGTSATKQIGVGWNEGQALASARIAQLQRHRCDDVTVYGLNLFLLGTDQCGRWVPTPAQATYLALYVSLIQIRTDRELAAKTDGFELVSTVRIRDIDYVEIWRRRSSAELQPRSRTG
jgi:hypothetical protein